MPPYTVSRPIKALVVIVNIQIYSKKNMFGSQETDERMGSEKDVNSICQAFLRLGIDKKSIYIRGPEVSLDEFNQIIGEFRS